MRTLPLFLLALLPLTLASPVLLGYSTLPNFLCEGAQNPECDRAQTHLIPSSSFSDLVSHLAAPETAHSDFPLARTNIAPELILVIKSATLRSDASSTIRFIRSAITPAGVERAEGSSFYASMDNYVSNIPSVKSVEIESVEKLTNLASDSSSSIFDNGEADVISLSVTNEDENGLSSALKALAERSNQKFAVLWTLREEAAAAEPENNSTAAKEDSKAPDSDKAENAKADAVNTMNRPEINDAQVAGLLVGLVFLLLFTSGFMCLWNIQPPQSFGIFDSNDVKKKMQ